MKIAVIDHQLNNGGGVRFLVNLLFGINEVDKDVSITLFCDIKKAEKLLNISEFKNRGIHIENLNSLDIPKIVIHTSIVKRAYHFAVKKIRGNNIATILPVEDRLNTEIAELSKDFEIIYFPWPYLLKRPNTSCPKVATFHDFNYKYFFGAPIYSYQQLDFLNSSIEEWLEDTVPVVSTNFMKDELEKFYPRSLPVSVIHIGSLNSYDKRPLISSEVFEYKFLLDKPYIVFPVHLTVHKNIGNVIAATSIINKFGLRFRLVLTGGSTEFINGRSGYCGLSYSESDDKDVYGLGYISDEQMHFLLKNSFAVVNASLYEAGNGVGLDAWSLGIPVLQSKIPAFEEHLNLQNFKAFTFDPRNVETMVEAINSCLENANQRNINIQESLVAASKLSWNSISKRYLELFKTAIKNKL